MRNCNQWKRANEWLISVGDIDRKGLRLPVVDVFTVLHPGLTEFFFIDREKFDLACYSPQ